jgi:hypothetical protein
LLARTVDWQVSGTGVGVGVAITVGTGATVGCGVGSAVAGLTVIDSTSWRTIATVLDQVALTIVR